MTGCERLRVSLIVSVLNEASTIDDLLDSIVGQCRQPDEIIVVDGGSSDGTIERVRSWQRCPPVRVIEAPGASISQGRNIALENATGDIVAVADAGVRLDPGWLERLVGALESDQAIDVASGFFRASPQTLFELALGVTTLPDVDEIDPERFLPSSRSVAFRRSWFEAGVRYPDWLDYCEDLVFDLRMMRAGARFRFAPEALVGYRPRTDLPAHWRQYRSYARGDGKSGLFLKRHLARYGSYGILVTLAIARRRWTRAALAGCGGAIYLRKPWRRLWRRRADVATSELVAAWLMIPLIRLSGDLAKMVGYPAGLLWRRRRYGLRRSWKTIPDDKY